MPSEVHKLSFLPVLASVVLVIGSLYWARAVFVPLALSLMLTFLLQPVVAVLHRWGLGYAPAAGLVVLLLALLIGAIGWVAVTQLSNLASELPRYQDNLKQKIEDLQHASQGGVFGKIQESVAELSRNFQKRQLPDEEARAIYQAMHELIDDLSASQDTVSAVAIASPTEEDTATVLPPKVHVLGCPAHDEADELALQML
jgi:predicted PurR-regulated permease PerM